MSNVTTTIKAPYTGRRNIYTTASRIDKENIVQIIAEAYNAHMTNALEIDRLYKIYCGDQEIRNKVKEIRPEINNKIVLNIAHEIVSFKVGYLLCEPIQYVNRSNDEANTEYINKLNKDMYLQDKESKDQELAEWMAICGVGYRVTLPKREDEDFPTSFKTFTLDPRETFVIRSKRLGNPVIAGVTFIEDENMNLIFSVYTENNYYEVTGLPGALTVSKDYEISLNRVAITEYAQNKAKIGEFELVLSALNAINEMESDRADAITNFVQALMLIKGMEVDEEDVNELKALGAILLPPEGDIKYITAELNQTQTQTYVDDLYQRVLEITGLPVTGDGKTSDSSNNGSTILRNGWYGAETRAKLVETSFTKSEKEFLQIVCHIINTIEAVNIPVETIKPKFTRRNYENIVEKSQVLINLLSNDKIYPELAFQVCNLFADPEMAWTASRDYYEEQVERQLAELETEENQAENGVTEETEPQEEDVNV